MKKVALYLFMFASIGELATTFISLPELQYICKPMIMISLGLYYVLSVHQEDRSISLIGAILFSCVGDALLMFNDTNRLFFKSGLGAFLVAHIFYILTYRQHRIEGSPDRLLGVHKMRLAFPIILSASGLLVILYPGLGDLKVPVIVYTLVIIFMVLNALFRYGLTNTQSFFMVFSGAILFMISDSVLAISKFRQPIGNSNFIVMLSYCIAQFLIVIGLLQHHKAKT